MLEGLTGNVDWLVGRVLMLIPLWLSLDVHEWAHAWAAKRLGDDTAERLGRLTLNPLAHIDPIGTLLLPLLGVPFGWAKPVPVQPHRFHPHVNMRTGMLIVAAAGPLANLALAAVVILLLAVAARLANPSLSVAPAVSALAQQLVFLNVILAAFNALPIPPLDGSRIAEALVPEPLRPVWEDFCRLGPFALLALIVLLPASGIDLFRWPLQAAQWLLWLAIGQP